MEALKWRRVSAFSSCLSLFPMGWAEVWDWLLNDVGNNAVKRVLENGAATDIPDQMLWDAQHSQAKVYHIEICTALVQHLTPGQFWGENLTMVNDIRQTLSLKEDINPVIGK